MSFYEKIQEPISVIALFEEQHKPSIHKFSWKDRVYKVDEVNLINKMFKGQDVIYMFSVTAHQANTNPNTPRNDLGAYKLRFDTSTLGWWLEEIYWE